MKVLIHHIYEYKKGLRNLVLHTINTCLLPQAENRLQTKGINYLVQMVSPDKANIFFGSTECVEVIRQFGNKPLNEFSPEQDFILGIMLGYDRLKQCQRYLNTKSSVHMNKEHKHERILQTSN